MQASVLKVLHENSCMQENLHNMYETVMHATMKKLREICMSNMKPERKT
jgi:hypothetical protein